jgi:hypothetical protein
MKHKLFQYKKLKGEVMSKISQPKTTYKKSQQILQNQILTKIIVFFSSNNRINSSKKNIFKVFSNFFEDIISKTNTKLIVSIKMYKNKLICAF